MPRKVPSVEEVYMISAKQILIAHAVYFGGDWDKLINAIRTRQYIPEEDVIKVTNSLKCNAITMLDKEYPEYLRQVYKPPIVLFYEGDISLIQNPKICMAVIGTRHPSVKAKELTIDIVLKTCKRYITVSGLASGIDRTAHVAAIKGGGKTIAVLGSGIDYCYPSENSDIFDIIKKDHLLISEYPPGASPSPDHFPFRNRLIAAICKGILITEAAIKSGTSITASFGLYYGRDVMCLPSNDYKNSGCNKLIKEGAYLVEDADDVSYIMG